MKYQKTVNYYRHEEAIRAGKLKLQVGQWINLDASGGKPSRFCWATLRTIYAVHPEGDRGISRTRFSEAVACWPNRPKSTTK